MRRWLKVGGALAGALVAGGSATLLLADQRWERDTRLLTDRFGDARLPTVDDELLATLPAPVRRWMRASLPPGPAPRALLVRQRGTFLTRAPDGWSPFTATSRFAASPPAFVWDARIRMAPGLTMRVRDSYLGGEGRMLGALAGLVRVVDQHGTVAMAEASLQRFIAEAAWLPGALLPCDAVEWEAVDDSTATVTVHDAGISASVDFHFTPAGDVARITAERWRDVNGTPVLTPWVGTWRDWTAVDGVRVPMWGEVGWMIDGTYQAYWRGRITRVAFVR